MFIPPTQEHYVELYVQVIREKDQQDVHVFFIIYFTYIIFDMFQTNNCSSSGGLYKQLAVFHHTAYEESSRCQQPDSSRCAVKY